MRTRFIPSAYILMAVAAVWTAGMLLLHFNYVAPRIHRQGERMDRDIAGGWLRQSDGLLQLYCQKTQETCSRWARSDTLDGFAQSRQVDQLSDLLRTSMASRTHDTYVAFCNSSGVVLKAWLLAESGVCELPEAGQDWKTSPFLSLQKDNPRIASFGQGPWGIGVFARCTVTDVAGMPGHLVVFRKLDRSLLDETQSLVGASVQLDPAPASDDQVVSPWAGPQVERLADHSLQGIAPLTDLDNRVVALLRAQGPAEMSFLQNHAVGQALLTTLLWAAGFATLMVVLIHAMISGPTARLVHRVERLKAGEVSDLSTGLRGEALVLAKRFEEALGRIEKISETDSLTGVHNRRSFRQCFVREFHRARRYNRPLSLAILDLDYLKAANDVLGHQTGDMIIQVFARVIADNVRSADMVARLGGDEFAVLMPETTEEKAGEVVERVRSTLAAKTVGRGEVKISPTTSIGVADLNVPEADTPDNLFNMADKAMYAAKKSGRNRVVRASQIDSVNVPSVTDQNKVDHLCKQLAGLDAKFKRLFIEAIGGLISVLEARDEHTANHSVKVRQYATLIAAQMNLSQPTIEHISRAAMLHDIGKIGLPDSVLLKQGPLTEAEWKLVQRHPVISVRIMEGMEFLDQEIPAVRYHHERFDGGGYPDGLAGSCIPLPARILAVADAFDAMTSARVYRSGMPVEQAMEQLRQGSGLQFDPAVVDAFLQVVAKKHICDQTLQPPLAASA